MLLSNSSVKWSSADSVEWSFLFPLCRLCMTLFESRKLVNYKSATLSHSLDKIGSSDIGLVFAGSLLSPDLRIGAISAFFYGSRKVLKVKELLIRFFYNGSDNWWAVFQDFGVNFITTGGLIVTGLPQEKLTSIQRVNKDARDAEEFILVKPNRTWRNARDGTREEQRSIRACNQDKIDCARGAVEK